MLRATAVSKVMNGREIITIGDRGEIDRITAELEKEGNRLRDLVHLIVQSRIFLNK